MNFFREHPAITLALIDRIEQDAVRNLLPFWMEWAVDPNGGFIGALSNELVPDPAAKRGMLLTTRILWAYSAAYRRRRDPAFLAMA
ncbi:MAG: hypothetical protein ACREFX_09625 [Opitutaceae bacterium]